MSQSTSLVVNVLFLELTLSILEPPPPRAEAAISCSTVASYLSPCLNYVLYDGDGAPPATCCSGIRELYDQARATADRQSICLCIESVASSATPEIIIYNAAALPGKCGFNIPFKISPSTDCSTIQ